MRAVSVESSIGLLLSAPCFCVITVHLILGGSNGTPYLANLDEIFLSDLSFHSWPAISDGISRKPGFT